MKKLTCYYVLLFVVNFGFSQPKIDTLLLVKTNIRALEIDQQKVWYAGTKGHWGYVDLETKQHYTGTVLPEMTDKDFRSMAQTKQHLFILSIAQPAIMYKIDKTNPNNIEKVYFEDTKDVFYDSMIFINEKEGFAIGDPTNNKWAWLQTLDGGLHWQKIVPDNFPKMQEGEAFFAASNTTLNFYKGRLWVTSGGKISRVFVSDDKGKTWQIYTTPMEAGESMTGTFAADFYNQQIGFLTGGNYAQPLQNRNNKAITYDGGKSWNLVANGTDFGYGSCVQFVPQSKGKQLLTVGASGVFVSNNAGKKWQKVVSDSDYFTIRFVTKKTAILAGKGKIAVIKL